MKNGNPLLIKAKRLRLYLWIYLKRLIHLSQFVTWLFFQYHKTYSKLFYLLEQLQRVNINSNFSEWYKILLGVPEGSILGPLLSNIHINDNFLFCTRRLYCNFADDNSLYSIEDNFKEVKTRFRIVELWNRVTKPICAKWRHTSSYSLESFYRNNSFELLTRVHKILN